MFILTSSTWILLYRDPHEHVTLVYYKLHIVGKQAVCILLECFLVCKVWGKLMFLHPFVCSQGKGCMVPFPVWLPSPMFFPGVHDVTSCLVPCSLGVYDVTSCLVPCSFRGSLSRGKGVSVRKGGGLCQEGD